MKPEETQETADETLAQWRAEEAAVRARLAGTAGYSRPAEGRLVGPDGKLYAHATTTCLIFDRKESADASRH